MDIRFDPTDIADCKRALLSLKIITERYHGMKAVQRLLLSMADSNRDVQRDANLRLMVAYISGQISAKQCSRELAKKNKSLPRDRRYGGGSTNPEAIEKQIRREKKRMEKNGSYKKLVELLSS
jgi:hypothetical protein